MYTPTKKLTKGCGKKRDAFILFEDFLQECEDTLVFLNRKDEIRFLDLCSHAHVFVFCTGTSRPLPLGFGRRMTLLFSHSGVMPTSFTCALTLTLPTTQVENEAAFFRNLALGFKSYDMFGQI